MFARFALGVLLAGGITAPVLAQQQLGADEARKFVANKLFSFNCFDGTKGAGRIYDDGSAIGSVQFGGSGPIRHLRLPTNTLQVRGGSVCASLKGMPFDPCFNLNKYDEVSFRGSVSGLGFAYCDFHRQGNARTFLTRMISRKPRSLQPPEAGKSSDKASEASRPETARAEVRSEPVAELRKTQD
jgi:hypothetical protein